MSALELKEAIPVVTPQGNGWALFVEFDNHDNFWTVALSGDKPGESPQEGALVTFPQEQVRLCRSYTHGRGWTHEAFKGALQKSKRGKSK